ncbi:hypothetical protein Hanom_Chr16g01430121 [Helianthus anomalus]
MSHVGLSIKIERCFGFISNRSKWSKKLLKDGHVNQVEKPIISIETFLPLFAQRYR